MMQDGDILLQAAVKECPASRDVGGGAAGDIVALRVLDGLRYGFAASRSCAPPRSAARLWGRLRSMKRTDGGAPGDIERLFMAFSGGRDDVEILVCADNGTVDVFLGLPDENSYERAVNILAPTAILHRERPNAIPQTHLFGLTYRLQPNGIGSAGDRADDPNVRAARLSSPWRTSRFPFLERAHGISGRWSLLIRCRATTFDDRLGISRRLDHLAATAARYRNLTVRTDDVTTATVASQPWRQVDDWVASYRRWLACGRADGLWSVCMWAWAGDERTSAQIRGMLHHAVPDNNGHGYDMLELQDIESGTVPPMSMLTTTDLGGMLCAPDCSVPGLRVQAELPQARRAIEDTGKRIELGRYRGTDIPAAITLDDLIGHAFITGVSGSGKTTTLNRLLAELWNRNGIPFLLVNPLKDEYEPIAGCFDGGLRIVRGRDLRMNIMEPWPGQRLADHLSEVAGAIRSAFAFPVPTPFVVTQLFESLADELGGPDDDLSCGRTGDTVAAAMPTLFDIRDRMESFVRSLGYGREVESNILAALRLRFNLLLAPGKARRFCWADSSMIARMFDRPTVISLGDISDEEERGFLVLLLAQAVWAEARRRGAGSDLRHVLVLEEAHRVMPQVGDELQDDPEHGSAQRSSAMLLSSMLAEIRGFGESIIVADQSPSRVARDVSRNTNLKIVHRLVDTRDRHDVADMLGLGDNGTDALRELDRGVCIVSSMSEPSPQTIAVEQLTPLRGAGDTTLTASSMTNRPI